MNNFSDNRLPFLYEIRTVDGYTILINATLIEKVEYNSSNTNWSNVYITGYNTPFVVRFTPDEFYSDVINDYITRFNK